MDDQVMEGRGGAEDTCGILIKFMVGAGWNQLRKRLIANGNKKAMNW